MKTLKIKDICDKGSSSLKQKDVEGKEGKYPVFGASGYIGSIDTYHQDKDYIAIVKDGSIGRVTFMPAYSSVIGTMQYILPKEGYNIKYISYCLQSLDLAKYKQGATIPHIYFRDYGESYVNIEESLSEQERIVAFLDAQFAKIDAIKANAEKQLQDAKALFQSALKDLLTPKEGWRCCKLSEIGQSKIGPFGSLLHKKDYITGGIPLINPMHIKNGLICEDFNFSISIEKRNELLNYVLQEFDIILGRRGEMGRCAVVSEREKGWLCGTGSIIFRPDIKIVSPYFLQLSISTPRNVKKLEKLAGGATMLNLSSSGLNQLELDLPTLKEQYEIVEVLEEIKSKIQSLQSNYDQTITLCNDLKQSILKDIFG